MGNPCLTEGDSGTKLMVFQVLRLGDVSGESSMNWTTVQGTAKPVTDYVTTSGSFTMETWDIFENLSVPIVGDKKAESTETFEVRLSNVVGRAGVGRRRHRNHPRQRQDELLVALLHLHDDPCGDDHHFMALNNSGVTEGDNGTSWLRFDVVLSTPFARPVVVDFTTVAGTAKASKDFVARKGKLAFLPGETMKSVRVKVVGDRQTGVEREVRAQALEQDEGCARRREASRADPRQRLTARTPAAAS